MKKIGLISLLILFLTGFYFAADWNYKQRKIENLYIISKPSALPTTETAKLTSFGFTSVKADYYWLQLIQYIGGNLDNHSYKEYFYHMTDLITELSPYFEAPYVIAQDLLPNYNPRYEKLDKNEKEKYINEAIAIGQKAVKNFCNKEKLALIKNEQNLEKLFTEKKYRNPCSKFEPIYKLAYIYFYHKNDPETSTYYYKATSVIDGSPEGAKSTIGVINGRGGRHKKSFFMQLNMARYTNTNDICTQVANQLDTVGKEIFSRKELPTKLLQQIEEISVQAFPYSDEILAGIECDWYINKAVRELNLYYLGIANKRYFQTTGKNAISAKELLDTGYIDYIPKDFQNTDTSQIIYFYNNTHGSFDHKFGNYKDLERRK